MQVQNAIEKEINHGFHVAHMALENESYMHNVPTGSESHFKLVLVSDDFIGKRLVHRHQMVYGSLKEQMNQIHALALHLYTIEEWEQRNETFPLSPKCQGGGH